MCKLQIGDVEMKQIKQFKYTGNIVIDEEKCDSEIRSRIRIRKAFFQKPNKVLAE